MTLDEAILIITVNYSGDDEMAQAIDILLADHRRLKYLVSDQLPNGGRRVHNEPKSMQPTFKNDKDTDNLLFTYGCLMYDFEHSTDIFEKRKIIGKMNLINTILEVPKVEYVSPLQKLYP